MSLKIGVYGLPGKEHFEQIASLDRFEEVEYVLYEESLAQRLGYEGYSLEEIDKKDIDFIMSIGGDGTILRIMQTINSPVLGVNTGTLGFLTSVEISKIESALQKIDSKDYFIDKRIKLDVLMNGEKCGECLNEVVVHSDKIAKLRDISVLQDGYEIDRFRGDGVIIATPTGSTSYALSSGGPIVKPELDLFLSVPVASFDLDAKPYVLPAGPPIEIKLMDEDKSCQMVLDGQVEFMLDSSDKIEVRKSKNKSKFIRFERDFHKKVKKKLVSR